MDRTVGRGRSRANADSADGLGGDTWRFVGRGLIFSSLGEEKAVNAGQVLAGFGIAGQKPDGLGSNQVVSIEFGPQMNTAMTQGANEAWVLGQRETLKRDLKRYERTYITNFKRWGIGINQAMMLAAIVFLPSLSGLKDRAILMGVVLALIFAVNWLHSRYVPYAAIYLREKKKGWLGKAWPRVASWGIGIVATVIAGLAAAYLQGALKIPAPSPAIEAPRGK